MYTHYMKLIQLGSAGREITPNSDTGSIHKRQHMNFGTSVWKHIFMLDGVSRKVKYSPMIEKNKDTYSNKTKHERNTIQSKQASNKINLSS